MKRLILMLVGMALGLGILIGPAMAPAESKAAQSQSAEAAVNRWYNSKKSTKFIYVKDGNGKVSKVQPGGLIPKGTKSLRAPRGYKTCNYSVRSGVCNDGNTYKWTKIASSPAKAFTTGAWTTKRR